MSIEERARKVADQIRHAIAWQRPSLDEVAAMVADAIRQEVLAEREACASLAENVTLCCCTCDKCENVPPRRPHLADGADEEIAEAIRGRPSP